MESRDARQLSSLTFGALKEANISLLENASSNMESTPNLMYNETRLAKDRGRSRRHASDLKRIRKNAPTEISAKATPARAHKSVHSRPRIARDPRFDGEVSHIDKQKSEANYAFLKGYTESEIADLRLVLKNTRNQAHRLDLEAQLRRLESKTLTRHNKEREQEVIRRQQRSEKLLVQEGKKPYYLKKKDQKTLSITEKLKGLPEKTIDKAILKQHKKQAIKARQRLENIHCPI